MGNAAMHQDFVRDYIGLPRGIRQFLQSEEQSKNINLYKCFINNLKDYVEHPDFDPKYEEFINNSKTKTPVIVDEIKKIIEGCFGSIEGINSEFRIKILDIAEIFMNVNPANAIINVNIFKKNRYNKKVNGALSLAYGRKKT
jgi:hypothetical protein